MKIVITMSMILGLPFFLINLTYADELIQYGDNGSILGRMQCDKISVHDSLHQSTIICTKTPKVDLNIEFVPLRTDSDYRSCFRDRNCVVIDNDNDPAWRPIALYGIPEATFGINARGSSCVRIRETKPRFATWEKDIWKLCTNDPQIELSYTYSYGYKNDGIERRFKQRDARKACFGEVLRGYEYRKFWTDNCIFVRQK